MVKFRPISTKTKVRVAGSLPETVVCREPGTRCTALSAICSVVSKVRRSLRFLPPRAGRSSACGSFLRVRVLPPRAGPSSACGSFLRVRVLPSRAGPSSACLFRRWPRPGLLQQIGHLLSIYQHADNISARF